MSLTISWVMSARFHSTESSVSVSFQLANSILSYWMLRVLPVFYSGDCRIAFHAIYKIAGASPDSVCHVSQGKSLSAAECFEVFFYLCHSSVLSYPILWRNDRRNTHVRLLMAIWVIRGKNWPTDQKIASNLNATAVVPNGVAAVF